MRFGVLGLQGDAPEHRKALEELLGADGVRLVSTPRELETVNALALPGGESTTISRLLDETRLREPLAARIAAGLPVLATCAGLILLSRRLERSSEVRDPTTLPILDVTVRRNDYGRQKESFEGPVKVEGVPGRPFPGVFIRAPRILSVGPEARVVAERAGEPVGVAQGKVWGLTFHPELSGDRRLHAHFLATTLGWSR